MLAKYITEVSSRIGNTITSTEVIVDTGYPGLDALMKKHSGLYINGGFARDLLFSKINKTPVKPLRDIDLIIVGNIEEVEAINTDISKLSDTDKKFSNITENEYTNGIKNTYSSIEQYMKSRDVTINQVLYRDNTIIYTMACYYDMAGRKARSTKFEFDTEMARYDDHGIGPRASLRTLLFATRLGLGIPYGTAMAIRKSLRNAGKFDLVIAYLKAFETGVEYKFSNLLHRYGIGTGDPNTDLLDSLSQLNNFELRNRNGIVEKAINNTDDVDLARVILSIYPELKPMYNSLEDEGQD